MTDDRSMPVTSALSRRRALIGSGAITAAAALPMFDLAAAPRAYTLAPKKLTDGVWMISGAQEAITMANGGAIANIGIVDTADGAVVIDTGPSKRFGVALAALAKELTGKPVVRAYLTHVHPDHVFGCQAFGPGVVAGTEILANALKQDGDMFSTAMYGIAGDWMRGTDVVVPTTIVDKNVEDIGGRRFRLLKMKGHTSSDLVVYDEKTGIMFAGDLVFLDRAPTTPNADLTAWRIALSTLGGIPHAMIVPGHGPAEESSNRGTEQTRRWIEMVEKTIGDAFEQGLDMNEAALVALPAWTEAIALARYEFERSVAHLYPKLEAARLPKVGGRI